MKKTALLSILCYFISTPLLFSQIKNYIPIVRAVHYEKTKETFENIANKFEQKNYHELAEIFRSFATGGHGTGFVYVDTDGENYIITNRHVVANSEFVNLEFTTKANTKTVYESCPIVYTDNDIDLAVVKFPDNEKVFTKSFSINSSKQSDGQEIWSAGFPGLLGKPMWQFAKGNITNEEAYVDQLLNPTVSYLIQHSASIDPGNSGGPLVIKDENSIEGYSVIGINTWTITNRQNTFFAIPAKNFPALVNNARKIIALQQNKDSLRNMLIKQCHIFAAEINSDKPKWDNVMGNVSYAFVGNKGWDSFIKMLADGDSEILKQLESQFFNYSPIEAMRFAISYQIWKRVYSTKNKLSDIHYKGINLADEAQFSKSKSVRTNFLIDSKEQEIEWIFEHGHWRISNYDMERNAVADKDKNKNDDNYDSSGKPKKPKESTVYFGFSIFGTPFSSFNDKDLNSNFNLKGGGGAINFTAKNLTVFARANFLGLDNKMKNPPPTVDGASVSFLQITNGILITILKAKKLSPYVLGGLCYTKYLETGTYKAVTETNKFEYIGLQGGVGLRYKITKKWGVFCEGSYYMDSVLPKVIQEDLIPLTSYEQSLSNLQVLGGISFDLRKK